MKNTPLKTNNKFYSLFVLVQTIIFGTWGLLSGIFHLNLKKTFLALLDRLKTFYYWLLENLSAATPSDRVSYAAFSIIALTVLGYTAWLGLWSYQLASVPARSVKNRVGQVYAAAIPANGQPVSLPILMYHRVEVSPPGSDALRRALAITPEKFENEMAYLTDNGYRSVNFDDLYAALYHSKPLPEKSVLITFDDGYQDNYQNAFPILKKYGQRGTFFVMTAGIDNPEYMSEKELKEMSDAGMDIQSHTVHHPDLRKLYGPRMAAELTASRHRITQITGRPTKFLAYPYGYHNRAVEQASQASGYLLAVTTQDGLIQKPDQPYLLVRRAIYPNLTLQKFAEFVR